MKDANNVGEWITMVTINFEFDNLMGKPFIICIKMLIIRGCKIPLDRSQLRVEFTMGQVMNGV